MKKTIILIAVLLPAYGFSWGLLGHRVVGQIAERYLKPGPRLKIENLLGNESVAMCANWADFIKSDSSYNYLSSWHYNNFSPGLSREAFFEFLKSDTAYGAYKAFNYIQEQLKKKALPRQKQVMYLKLLIHIVGDMHQPLHMGRKEDLGGNRIRVMWFNENVNLHQVWDERLINFQQLSYTEYERAINHPGRDDLRKWAQAPVEEWLYESYLCSEKIYAGITPEQKLGYRYNFDYIQMVNEQLLKGGIRLAAVLNDIYGK